MAVEDTDFIAGLNQAWPQDEDFAIEGAPHVRLTKRVFLGQFPGKTGDAYDVAVTVGPRELNKQKSYDAVWGNDYKAKFNSNDRLELDASGVVVTGRVAINQSSDSGVRLTRGAQTYEVFINSDSSLRILDVTTGQNRLVILPNGNIQLYNAAGDARLFVVDGGSQSPQHELTSPAPTAVNHATRKDYVDGQIANLQAQIDDLKNGFAFTGPISAPSITET